MGAINYPNEPQLPIILIDPRDPPTTHVFSRLLDLESTLEFYDSQDEPDIVLDRYGRRIKLIVDMGAGSVDAALMEQTPLAANERFVTDMLRKENKRGSALHDHEPNRKGCFGTMWLLVLTIAFLLTTAGTIQIG